MALGNYFDSLSVETRRRFGPHPLDAHTAISICDEVDHASLLRLVAITQGGTIVAYFLLKKGYIEHDARRYEERGMTLDTTAVTFAPSVADDYQSKKLGSAMMKSLFEAAEGMGAGSIVLWGGVQATNDRACGFYRKFGFAQVGEYEYKGLNFDKIKVL